MNDRQIALSQAVKFANRHYEPPSMAYIIKTAEAFLAFLEGNET